jgi:hypothetical protein
MIIKTSKDLMVETLGFSKGTLHYMKQNAKSDKSFTLNSHILERVKAWENLVSGGKLGFNENGQISNRINRRREIFKK